MTTKTEGNPTIAIIMPAYNAESFIKESIESVINQTYRKWQLIIVDDGSIDKTVQVIKEIIQNDDRIQLLKSNKNRGVSVARNKGISESSSEWIAFLDSDDKWEKTKLEKQIEVINKTGAEFVFTDYAFMNVESDYYQGIFKTPQVVDFKRLKKQNVINTSSVLIKKNLLGNIEMNDDNMHEDFALWLRILQNNIIAYGVNEPLTVYRISKTSKSGNKFKATKMTYTVYRFIGMNRFKSLYYTFRHSVGAFKKYNKLKID